MEQTTSHIVPSYSELAANLFRMTCCCQKLFDRDIYIRKFIVLAKLIIHFHNPGGNVDKSRYIRDGYVLLSYFILVHGTGIV